MASATRSTARDSSHAGLLDAHLARLGLDRSIPPGPEQWRRLLEGIEEAGYGTAPTAGVEGLLQRQVASRRANQTSLFEQSPVPIMQLDLSPIGSDSTGVVGIDGVSITAANQAADRFFGSGEPRPGIEHLGLPEQAKAALVAFVRSEASSEEFQFEAERPDGTSYEAILLAAVPRPFGIPDYTRVVVALIDISDQKAEERRVRDLVTSRNRLLASVTTQIRSPLAQVIDFAHLIEEQAEDPEHRRDLAHAIADGAVRVASIVEDLLVISRSELGDLAIAEVPVDLSAQVAQVLEVGGAAMSGVATPGRNVERRICLGDPARVRQVVRNLVAYSIEAGGDHLTITIHRRASTMRLCVASTGPVLDAEAVGRVFEGSDDIFGAPMDPRLMGLAVGRHLAREMRGELRYRVQDRRNEFEFSLRAAQTG